MGQGSNEVRFERSSGEVRVKADRARKDNPDKAVPTVATTRKDHAPASYYCAAETNFSGKLRWTDDKRNLMG
jgi:hypothetical protein